MLQSEIVEWEERLETEEQLKQMVVEDAERLEQERNRLASEKCNLVILYWEKDQECNMLLQELSDLTSIDWTLKD